MNASTVSAVLAHAATYSAVALPAHAQPGSPYEPPNPC